MRKKRFIEEDEHDERWVISYADFITLLFAFFVVMYSISSVNQGKYKTLSENLVTVFKSPNSGVNIFDRGKGEVKKTKEEKNIFGLHKKNTLNETELDVESSGHDKTFSEVRGEIKQEFGDMINDDLVSIKSNEQWIEIEIKSSFLFGRGGAELSEQAIPLIRDIAQVLRPYKNPIHIEGFTDNIPIETERYPSNWELSGARAAAVLRVMARNGVESKRMAAVAYGQYHALNKNRNEKERSRNRRVVLLISREASLRAHSQSQSQSKNGLEKQGNKTNDEDTSLAPTKRSLIEDVKSIDPEKFKPLTDNSINEQEEGPESNQSQGRQTQANPALGNAPNGDSNITEQGQLNDSFPQRNPAFQ